MKKLFVLAVAVLLSSFAFADTSSYVLTEFSQLGSATKTRTLTSDGVLTESVCVESAQGSQQLKNCISQTSQLSPEDTASMQASMRYAQYSVLAMAEASSSEQRSKSSASSTGSSGYRQAQAKIAHMLSSTTTKAVSASAQASR